jgi:hypothetical protein
MARDIVQCGDIAKRQMGEIGFVVSDMYLLLFYYFVNIIDMITFLGKNYLRDVQKGAQKVCNLLTKNI